MAAASDVIVQMQKESDSLAEQCLAYLKTSDDELLQKSHNACKDLLAMKGDDRPGKCLWLQSYARIILDVTFYRENLLVDAEFTSIDSESEVASILSELDKPEMRAKKWFGKDIKLTEVFGEEMYECLLWRKGALCYMYCCTTEQDEEQRKKKHHTFIKYCHGGVKFLQAMMAVRNPLDVPLSQVSTNDQNSFSLLSQGLFSDTHVLALMYGGELCAWFHQWSTSEDQLQYDWKNYKETGNMLLKCYLDACTGPLKGKGWSTSKAEILLQHLLSVKPS